MRIRSGLIATTAIALFISGSAFAQSASVSVNKDYDETVDKDVTTSADYTSSKEIQTLKNVSIIGAATVMGAINVSESAVALVDNTQILNDNNVSGGDVVTNAASGDGGVLAGATGRIGLNIAAGDNNAQDNATSMAAVGAAAAGGSGDAATLIYQESFSNDWSAPSTLQKNDATLLGTVLNGASGDIGANVAAGSYNIQKNALSMAAVSGATVLAEATATVMQQTANNTVSHGLATNNTASVAGDVLGGATGNIGANLGAGTSNVQANSLTLSVSN